MLEWNGIEDRLIRFYTFAATFGNKICVRGWDDKQGGHFQEQVMFRPTLFVPTKKPTKYKTLDGTPVSPVKPGTIKECRAFIDDYTMVDGTSVYGMERFLYQYLSKEFDDEIQYDIDKIKLWSLDIETASESGFPKPEEALEEVLLITLKCFKTKKLITFGSKPYTPTRDDVTYVHCPNEYDLLSTFITWWQDVGPEVITGWNVDNFDVTYLCNRLQKVCGEKMMRKLSPWNVVNSKIVDTRGMKHQKYEIMGVSILDYLELYRKSPATPTRESYRLDYIADVELGQKKLDHSEFDTFKDFYTNGWTKFVDYNLVDVDLVDKMEEKMKFIDLTFLMSYDAHCNYIDTFAQVRLWDVIIYNYLRKQNIVLNLIERSDKEDQYVGAYVKEPTPGAYDWVVSFDLNSLYPSLIRFLNISPETLEEHKHPHADVEDMILKKADIEPIAMFDDVCVAANGAMYRRDHQGFMPKLVKTIYEERVQYKKNMLRCKQEYENNPTEELSKDISKWSNFQMARKIQLNSLYGALGNQYFRHYRLDNAEAITLTGQVAIRWIERKVNEYLNKILNTDGTDYVIASDTDSIYLNLGDLVGRVTSGGVLSSERIVEILNDLCEEKIVPFIDKSYKELSDYLNCYEETLVMKRECIAEKGIWTAKKRYILNVWDNEGVRYSEPKLKIMGIEAVRSSTPSSCRTYIRDALKIMMSGTEDDLIEYIDTHRKEHPNLPMDEVSFPRTANNITKFKDNVTLFRKGTPMHVRAAILFNYLVLDRKLDNKYNLIGNGEKIKYVHLKVPNPSSQNVIAFINEFPQEFGLTEFIDYDIMYEKGFLDPLKSILDVIGWKTEHVTTLEDFFL